MSIESHIDADTIGIKINADEDNIYIEIVCKATILTPIGTVEQYMHATLDPGDSERRFVNKVVHALGEVLKAREQRLKQADTVMKEIDRIAGKPDTKPSDT